MDAKKSRILYVKRFLEEQTDEAHPATIADILAYLSSLGITAHRRTVILDIEQLMETGIDIVCNKGRRQNEYFIGDGLLELPELKLLLDATQASKFLTAKRSRTIINKLLSLVSAHQAKNLQNSLYLEKRVKPKNETAYITADLLLTAINTKRRVQFMYFEYTPEKKKVYKHGRRLYELSPWAFVWNNDSYYVIGHSKTHGRAANFRVDRIAAPKLTDLQTIPAPEDFDLAVYVQSVFQMYDGPLLDVTLKCRNDFMKVIVDRFGEGVHTEIADAKHFYAKVNVSASKTFYGWVFASGGAINITAPGEAVKAYLDMLEKAKHLQ
jgi:predicted DNA-binding transcriptional regulator YafY